MATTADLKLEPIKTALATGNYAEARRLRIELWRDALNDVAAGEWSDYQFQADRVAMKKRATDALLADALDIPEER